MKFIMKAILYIIVMNAVMIFGAAIFDCDYEFNILFNVVVPVICAHASYTVEQKKAKNKQKA